MKKIVSIVLAVLMTISVFGCRTNSSGSASAEDSVVQHETFKIGVLESQLNDESTNRVAYFNDYISPRYNVEFMFSEACTTLDAAMTFIENAADAGCQAIINYYPVAANTDQLIQLCQEYGMIFSENSGRLPGNEEAYVANYENFGGGFMADQPDTGRLFREYLVENTDPGEKHSFIVATGGAYQGNAQQTEVSINMLQAIAEIYDLKYDSTIEALITSASPVSATNDKGIEILCYPEAPNVSGWLEGLSAALQTGKYDYLLLAPQALGNIGNVVSEVEEALDKNITVIGLGSFGDALTNAFNTKDKFGNVTCSMSTVKFTSLVSAMAFSEVYNLLTDSRQAVLDKNGEPNVLLFRMAAVTSPAQLAEMNDWDTPGKWVANYDIVDSLLADFNENLTSEQIQERIYEVNYETIKDRLN